MRTCTDTERAALLPCPFCGEPAEMIRHAPIFHVRCRQWACGCHGSSTFEYSPEKAIISWNRRAPAAPVQIDPALVQAIQCAGLQVLKTATGYEVYKLGPAVAQSSVSNGENAAPVQAATAGPATTGAGVTAGAPVELPEPDGFLETHPFGLMFHRGKPSQAQSLTGPCPPMYTADTVRALLASARAVPQGWQMVPVEPTSKQIVLMAAAILDQAQGTADTRHPYWPQAVEQATKAYSAALEFAPKEPAHEPPQA